MKMNRSHWEAVYPVVTAFVQGRTVQFRSSPGCEWIDVEKPGFEHAPDKYRIKPTKADYRANHAACGIKVGDRVKITRRAKTEEDGWQNSWEPCMNDCVGHVGKVIEDDDQYGFSVNFSEPPNLAIRSYPYFVLEKINEPTYRPFANAEEFRPHRERWIKRFDGSDTVAGSWRVSGYDDEGVWGSQGEESRITYRQLLRRSFADNDLPCGVLEE